MRRGLPNIVKIYDQDDGVDVYFVDGERSLAYNDNSLLRELFGDQFKEIWIVKKATVDGDEREMIDSLWSAELIEEVDGIISAYPDLVEEEM